MCVRVRERECVCEREAERQCDRECVCEKGRERMCWLRKYVCVREREERERENVCDRDKDRVCVFVCVRGERDRESV